MTSTSFPLLGDKLFLIFCHSAWVHENQLKPYNEDNKSLASRKTKGLPKAIEEAEKWLAELKERGQPSSQLVRSIRVEDEMSATPGLSDDSFDAVSYASNPTTKRDGKSSSSSKEKVNRGKDSNKRAREEPAKSKGTTKKSKTIALEEDEEEKGAKSASSPSQVLAARSDDDSDDDSQRATKKRRTEGTASQSKGRATANKKETTSRPTTLSKTDTPTKPSTGRKVK